MATSDPELHFNAWQQTPEERQSSSDPELAEAQSIRSLLSPTDLDFDRELLLPKQNQSLRKRSTVYWGNRISWLNRKSRMYDEFKDPELLDIDANGQRVWYENYTTIDWIHDYLKDRVHMKTLRNAKGVAAVFKRWFDSMQAWILVLLIGLLCALVAAFIEISESWLQGFRYGVCIDDFWKSVNNCESWKTWAELSETYLGTLPLVNQTIGTATFILLCTLMSFLSVLLVLTSGTSLTESKNIETIVYYSSGSGIPELKTVLSGFVIRGLLGLKTFVFKTLGLVLSMSCGLMIGKQGPVIHIACCIGNIASRLFEKYSRNEAKKREILSASVAAGVSVAFAAPLGGVLFSLEEVSYYFPFKTMWRTFFCALIASMTFKLLDPLGTGKEVLFQVSFERDWYAFELVPFAFLGILGGLYGAFFINFATWWTRKRKEYCTEHPIKQVLMVSLLTACVSSALPIWQISNGSLVGDLLGECDGQNKSWVCSTRHLAATLVLSLIVKVILMCITFGIRVPSGFFMPSMTVGALLGRLVGTGMVYFVDHFPISSSCSNSKECIVPGVYALVGAASALCGVTRMTISLVIIMFELTGSLSFALPVMVAVIISKWVADAVCSDSLYDRLVVSQGHPYLDHKKSYTPQFSVTQVMDTKCFVFNSTQLYSFEEISHVLSHSKSRDGGFPIVKRGYLVGYIAFNELEYFVQKTIDDDTKHLAFSFQTTEDVESPLFLAVNSLSKYINKAPLAVSDNSPIDLVLELFKKLGIKSLIVLKEGRYVGLIHKKRLLSFLKPS